MDKNLGKLADGPRLPILCFRRKTKTTWTISWPVEVDHQLINSFCPSLSATSMKFPRFLCLWCLSDPPFERGCWCPMHWLWVCNKRSKQAKERHARTRRKLEDNRSKTVFVERKWRKKKQRGISKKTFLLIDLSFWTLFRGVKEITTTPTTTKQRIILA